MHDLCTTGQDLLHDCQPGNGSDRRSRTMSGDNGHWTVCGMA